MSVTDTIVKIRRSVVVVVIGTRKLVRLLAWRVQTLSITNPIVLVL